MLFTDKEIEQRRHEQLAELTAGDELATLFERFGKDSFGAHEALDRLSVIVNLVESSVLNHPTVVLDQELYRLVRQAIELLEAAYHRAGIVEGEGPQVPQA